MYFKVSMRTNPATGVYSGYYRLVESFRNYDDRVYHRTILNAGYPDELTTDQLNLIQKILISKVNNHDNPLFEIPYTDDATVTHFVDEIYGRMVDEPSPVPSTLVGEAARTLIVFSGATIIPDISENYIKHPEILRFIASQKMPWNESKTLSGEIGEYIVVARQASDSNWLVGAATNEETREL
jgi:hypothetical protein